MFPYDLANMNADFAANLPRWVMMWMNWMLVVNLLAIIFIKKIEARWALAGIVGAFITVSVLYGFFGLSRILGLGHVLVWTPLAIYLIKRIRAKKVELKTVYGIWLCLLLATILISLAFDYLDVIRYMLGERELITMV